MMVIKKLTKEYLNNNIDDFLDIIQDGYNEYWNIEHFLFDLPDKWETSIYIEVNSQLTAFIISSKKKNTFHIHKFFVHKDYRSNGLGHRLLNEYEKLIRSRKELKILSLKVYKKNKRAILFYNKNGFITETNENELLILKKELE